LYWCQFRYSQYISLFISILPYCPICYVMFIFNFKQELGSNTYCNSRNNKLSDLYLTVFILPIHALYDEMSHWRIIIMWGKLYTEFGTALTTILPILFQYCYKYCYRTPNNLPKGKSKLISINTDKISQQPENWKP
jgi:hypothetical protein